MEENLRKKCPWMEYTPGMKTICGNLEDQYRILYTPDVVYADKGRALRLQLLTMRAPQPGKKYPLLVYITGSGWQQQAIYDRLPQLVEFARCGYVVASVEYRHTDEGARFPSQIEDAKTAIRFLRAHAEEYQIDAERVAVWGDSSGAHTAVMAGITGDAQFSSPDDPDQSARVNCIVDFYGPSDLASMGDWDDSFKTEMEAWGEGAPLRLLFGAPFDACRDVVANATPLNYINGNVALPPVLIMHGDHDRMVHFHQSVLLYEKLKSCGQQADLYMVRNAAHGFQFWTEEVMDVVRKFLKAYL